MVCLRTWVKVLGLFGVLGGGKECGFYAGHGVDVGFWKRLGRSRTRTVEHIGRLAA